MMKKYLLVCVGMLLALLLAANLAQAAVIFNHQGANDPATEGFGNLSQGTYGTIYPTVGPVNDGGTNAWKIDSMTYANNYAMYAPALTVNQAIGLYTNGWELTVVARVVQTYQTGNSNFGGAVWLRTAGLWYALDLNVDQAGTTTPANTVVYTANGTYPNQTYQSTTIPGNGYNTYKLVCLPESVNPSYYASLYINGVLAQTNIKGLLSSNQLQFGDLSPNSGQSMDVNWARVTLVSPIPEPATLSLLMMAAAGMLLRKKH